MYKFFIAVAATVFLSCNTTNKTTMQSSDSNQAAGEDGFVNLFDGKTTKGWHTYGKTGVGKAWKVVDGTLHLDAASKKDWQTAEGGDIVSDEEFENFHLKLDWKL